MTAKKLQDIAVRLSNAAWVRHWLHWNYPTRSPWVMAIQVRDVEGRSIHIRSLDTIGFEWDEDDQMHYIDRTDEDGTPIRSEL
jgi:hypothetical protein